MDQDATWYGGRPRPMPHCVSNGNPSPEWGAAAPLLFSAHFYCGHGRPSQLLLSSCVTLMLLSWCPIYSTLSTRRRLQCTLAMFLTVGHASLLHTQKITSVLFKNYFSSSLNVILFASKVRKVVKFERNCGLYLQ